MNKTRKIALLTDHPERPTRSSGAYKVHSLLKKGRAYQVRGHWRFRGIRGHIRELQLFSLLEKGFAE